VWYVLMSGGDVCGGVGETVHVYVCVACFCDLVPCMHVCVCAFCFCDCAVSVGLYVHMCGCVHTSGRRAFLGPKGMSCGRWPICPLTHMSIPQQAPGEESEVGPFISSPPSLLLKSSAN
jgi:hypothetical protein